MKLTLKRLRAMECALGIILAGEEGEGDAADVPFADFEAALDWVQEQIRRRLAAAKPDDEEREYWAAEARAASWRESQWGVKS